jgi:hypothetical protein
MTQIGVDHADDLGVARVEPLDDGGAQTELAGTMDDLDGIPRRQVVGDAARAVGRVVVHDDEIAVDAARLICVEHGLDEIGQAVALVVRRSDERQRRSGGGARGQNP